jgi:hypothetical protein
MAQSQWKTWSRSQMVGATRQPHWEAFSLAVEHRQRGGRAMPPAGRTGPARPAYKSLSQASTSFSKPRTALLSVSCFATKHRRCRSSWPSSGRRRRRRFRPRFARLRLLRASTRSPEGRRCFSPSSPAAPSSPAVDLSPPSAVRRRATASGSLAAGEHLRRARRVPLAPSDPPRTGFGPPLVGRRARPSWRAGVPCLRVADRWGQPASGSSRRARSSASLSLPCAADHRAPRAFLLFKLFQN